MRRTCFREIASIAVAGMVIIFLSSIFHVEICLPPPSPSPFAFDGFLLRLQWLVLLLCYFTNINELAKIDLIRHTKYIINLCPSKSPGII